MTREERGDRGERPGSSAAGRLLGHAWRRASDGWRATSPDARRGFLVRLGIACVVVVVTSAAAALALQAVPGDGGPPGDAALAERAEGLMSVHSALWVGAFTSSAMAVPILLVAALLAARASRWERAVEALAAFVASKAIIWAGWLAWARERPADLAGGVLVPADMPAFPSGHSVQVWTVYGLLALWWARATDRRWERIVAWGLVVVLTAVVGAGRVRIGAHYPSDILGGAVLGGLWVVGVAWAERAGPLRRARA